MAPLAAPEPMNATTNHSKLKVSVTLPNESVVAGGHVTGKMEVECKSDKLGIGIIMVELLALQELTSRDHSARMTFLQTRRLFQGPGLPPSNAVHAFPLPGDSPLPDGYHQAKRGHSIFFFRIPIPRYIPASINFVSGLAKVRYEVRASVGVYWKGEKQLVTDKDEAGVLECFEEDSFDFGTGSKTKAEDGVVVVGENGRFWMHSRIIGGLLVAGESACVELQVKNHSSRKNTSLVLSLNRTLILPTNSTKPLEISDTILTVPYRGREYTLPPGGEGVAHLVFDVPITARSVRGGMYDGDEDGVHNSSEALFSIQASVEVKVGMGLGSQDIKANIPVTIVHPDALPDIPQPPPAFSNPRYAATSAPAPHIDPQAQHAWVPNPQHQLVPMSYAYDQRYYPQQVPIPYPHLGAYTPFNVSPQYVPHRPSSAGPLVTSSHPTTSYVTPISGLPISPATPPRLLPLPNQSSSRRTHASPGAPPLPPHISSNTYLNLPNVEGVREQGQGVVASRISRHLRQTSVATGRGRSTSPVAHRFGYPEPIADALANNAGDVGDRLITTSNDGGGTTEPILHSPRPQIQHKRSYTTLNGKDVAKSENVVELEKLAAGLLDDTAALSRRGGKEKMLVESTPKAPPTIPRDVNKTLPVPPPLTKPRHLPDEKPGNTNVPVILDSLFTPLSPSANSNAGPAIKATSPHDSSGSVLNLPSSSSDANLPTPRTPTLVAYKRPPKIDRGGGGGENGLDALEKRLLAEVGTRKQEKEKKPDVRDVLTSSSSATRDEVLGINVVKAQKTGTGTGTGTPVSSGPARSVPSTSTTPNPDMRAAGGGSASSERQDESAISSLTLDQSSVGDNDHDGRQMQEQEQVQEREKEKDREDDDQESMDGGKTHRAGKSVVGIESYFQSRNNHRREVAAVEPSSNTRSYVNGDAADYDASGARKANSPIPGKKKAAPAALRKSAQTRGRVAAWLGNIDPDEPPQEEIIPPSPSVVKPLEYEWDDEYVEGQSAEKDVRKLYRRKDRPDSRSHSRSSSWSPPPIPVSGPTPTLSRQPTLLKEKNEDQIETVEAGVATSIAVSPDPRSSGFMPIETMKAQRDSVTKSMSRSLMRHFSSSRDMTVAREARKVMDIWSEGIPGRDSSLKQPGEKHEKKRRMDMEYPLMKPIAPKTQTVRTDKKVSPPSVSTLRPGGAVNPETGGERSITSPPKGNKPFNGLLTPPMSYANVASGASRPTSPAVVTKGGAVVSNTPKPPVFPPLQRQDQEVKYDVRSARGGKGGQVTHVAALWAAVAAGGSSAGSITGSSSSAGKPALVKAGGKKEVKIGAGGSNAAFNRSQPNAPSNVKADTKKISATPSILPRETIATLSSPNASSTSTTHLNSHQAKPRPLPYFSSGSSPRFPLSGGKKPNPTSMKYGSRNPHDKTKNAAIPVQMKKSTSVPASVSSSFAIPMLSSTASLARPVGGVRNNNGKATGTGVGLPGVGKGAVPGEERKHKTRLGVVGEENSGEGSPDVSKKSAGATKVGGGGVVKHDKTGETVGQPRPPSREMVFGQARLRDLIKRYQS